MKQVIYGILMIIILVFIVLGVITIESRTNRENNAYLTLKRATDDAVESVLEEQSFTINTNEQFVAAVTQMICNSIIQADPSDSKDFTEIDDNLKLVIEVVEADYHRGLLCLNIIMEYTNPIGSIGTCEYSTTVVFDEAKLYDTYTINYFDSNGMLLQSYIVKAGDAFPEPSDALKSQYKITQWGSELGGTGDIFVVPDFVPKDGETNNITQYLQYNAADGTLNLYGNYSTR